MQLLTGKYRERHLDLFYNKSQRMKRRVLKPIKLNMRKKREKKKNTRHRNPAKIMNQRLSPKNKKRIAMKRVRKKLEMIAVSMRLHQSSPAKFNYRRKVKR